MLGSLSSPAGAIMNQGGVPYQISNPVGDGYTTDFEHNVKGDVAHFDVYGEVQTRYSQVYWTRNAPIDLPPELVKRFAGKTMAITGYEVDQVTHAGQGAHPNAHVSPRAGGALSGFACYPDCSESDRSVPIYNAYNHHYFSWLTGVDAEVYELDEPTRVPNPTRTGVRSLPNDHGFPTNIVFKENPGGEFRKSYHGYPSGYAQLIHSPTQWVVEPMQIDTHNRAYNISDPVGLKPSFLPAIQRNEMTQSNQLSPLIECPCSTRISRETVETHSILTAGRCAAPIASAAACDAEVAKLAPLAASTTVRNASLPTPVRCRHAAHPSAADMCAVRWP